MNKSDKEMHMRMARLVHRFSGAVLVFGILCSACFGAAEVDRSDSEIPGAQLELSAAGAAAVAGQVGSGGHCVVTAGVSRAQPTCFPTFSNAIRFATNGKAAVPDDVTPETLTEAQLAGAAQPPGSAEARTAAAAAAATTFVLAVHYRDKHFQGSTLTVNGGCTCSNGCISGLNVLPSGWDNQISSTKGFSGCGVTHWDLTHQTSGGAGVYICFADSPFCGAFSTDGRTFNDKTSSTTYSAFRR
jgi:hypothetical protein